jgi:UPF0271 protein
MPPVIDTNVVIHGRGDASLRNAFTVKEVLEELESKRAGEKGEVLDLETRQPAKEKIEEVRNLSDSINSPTSKVDEKLVALALTLDEKLVTDDKAVQNLAEKLDLEYEGYMENSIEQTIEWYHRCSNCGEEVSSSDRCPRCGSRSVVRKVR